MRKRVGRKHKSWQTHLQSIRLGEKRCATKRHEDKNVQHLGCDVTQGQVTDHRNLSKVQQHISQISTSSWLCHPGYLPITRFYMGQKVLTASKDKQTMTTKNYRVWTNLLFVQRPIVKIFSVIHSYKKGWRTNLLGKSQGNKWSINTQRSFRQLDVSQYDNVLEHLL